MTEGGTARNLYGGALAMRRGEVPEKSFVSDWRSELNTELLALTLGVNYSQWRGNAHLTSGPYICNASGAKLSESKPSGFLCHVSRIFILANAGKPGMAQVIRRRPIRKFDLNHQLRLNPTIILHGRRR